MKREREEKKQKPILDKKILPFWRLKNIIQESTPRKQIGHASKMTFRDEDNILDRICICKVTIFAFDIFGIKCCLYS